MSNEELVTTDNAKSAVDQIKQILPDALGQSFQDSYNKTQTANLKTTQSLSFALNGALVETEKKNKALNPEGKENASKIAVAKAAIPALVAGAAALSQPNQGKFSRPRDIACSIVIYPWQVSHMVFGRTVANHFLAVQVTVRNLDADHEFLIQDAELGVDAYSSQLERFQSSVEKQAVRGVTVYGQNYDRRSVWVHSVEGVGMIMGAIVGLPQPALDNLTAATGAYEAGFVPTFEKLFPDLSTNNLNNLNDLGFSAAAASRIVVPKGGSVPFVMFIPVTPLQQACWLQKGYIAAEDHQPNTACDAIYKPGKTAGSGSPGSERTFERIDSSQTQSWARGYWPTRSLSKKYRQWSPSDITALEKHSFGVIAGTHIAALDNQAASLRALSCSGPTDSKGTLSLGALQSDSSTCTLTGANLVNVMTLRWKSASSAIVVDAPVTHTSDSTTAQTVLTNVLTAKLTDPTYNLFSVDSSSTESDLKFSYTLLPVPVLSAPVAPPVLADLAAGKVLTLTGSNLAQVKDIQLVLNATKVSTSSISQNETQITAKFPTANLSSGSTYEIYLVLDDAKGTTIDSRQSLKL